MTPWQRFTYGAALPPEPLTPCLCLLTRINSTATFRLVLYARSAAQKAGTLKLGTLGDPLHFMFPDPRRQKPGFFFYLEAMAGIVICIP